MIEKNPDKFQWKNPTGSQCLKKSVGFNDSELVLNICSEAAIRSVICKKVFLEISQNSQENIVPEPLF